MKDFLDNQLSINDTVILPLKGSLQLGQIKELLGKDRILVKMFSFDPPRDVKIHCGDLYKIANSELTRYLLVHSK